MTVEIRKLTLPDDDPRETGFSLRTGGERLLVTDPTYIADYFDAGDAHTRFILEHGVVLSNFGGDLPCNIYWHEPYLVATFNSDPETDRGSRLAEDVAIDSGRLLFLPLTESIPADLRLLIDEALEQFGAAAIPVPAGRWDFFYQDAGTNGDDVGRNVVAKWTATETGC